MFWAYSQEGLDYQDEIGLFNYSKDARRSLQTGVENQDYEQFIGKTSWSIWRHTADGEAEVDPGPGPYMPTWQSSPVFFQGHETNENIYGSYGRNSSYIAFTTGSIVISDFDMHTAGQKDLNTSRTALYAQLLSTAEQKTVPYEGDPFSQVSFPIFDSFKQDRKPVAVLVAWIHWMDYFRDILPPNSKGVSVVLKNSCGKEYTYEVDGGDVRSVGAGDLHDTQFEDKKESTSFSSVDNVADGTKYGLPLDKDHCIVSIDVYPTQTFYDLYITATPVIVTVVVAIIFAFTALMFMLYDRLVARQQMLIVTQAARTNAIVASMFPKAVRDRLLHQTSKQAEKANKGGEFIAPNRRLQGFLSGSEDDDTEDAPIADLFPYCTGKIYSLFNTMDWFCLSCQIHTIGPSRLVNSLFDAMSFDPNSTISVICRHCWIYCMEFHKRSGAGLYLVADCLSSF